MPIRFYPTPPHGVVLDSRCLIHNGSLVREGMRVGDGAVFVNWMPHFHDMGLLGNILYPLMLGAQSVQMAPPAFLQKPVRWLKAIDRYRAPCSPSICVPAR